MPAKRLPWFKLWIGSTAHGKVRQLDDGTFRTWVELLDVAAQQPKRGRFESISEALAITRRPRKHVTALMSAGLMDQRADGLWMHDWDEWQRWRPEDANDTPTPPDHPPNGLPKDTRTTTEALANGHSLRARAAAPASGDIDVDGEVDEDVLPPAATQQPPTFSSDEESRINAVTGVLASVGFSGSPQFWRRVLDRYGELDLETEAVKQADWLRRNKKRSCSELRYLNWLDIAARKAANGTTQRSAPEDSERFAAFRKYA